MNRFAGNANAESYVAIVTTIGGTPAFGLVNGVLTDISWQAFRFPSYETAMTFGQDVMNFNSGSKVFLVREGRLYE